MLKSKLSELIRLERHALGHFNRPKRRSDWAFSLELLRLREVELVMKARHGSVLPETDHADLYIRAAALSLAGQDMYAGAGNGRLGASTETIHAIIAEVGFRRKMRARMGLPGCCWSAWRNEPGSSFVRSAPTI